MNNIMNMYPGTVISLVALIVLAICYRLVRYGIRIKAGSIEIDCEVNDKEVENERTNTTQE